MCQVEQCVQHEKIKYDLSICQNDFHFMTVENYILIDSTYGKRSTLHKGMIKVFFSVIIIKYSLSHLQFIKSLKLT